MVRAGIMKPLAEHGGKTMNRHGTVLLTAAFMAGMALTPTTLVGQQPQTEQHQQHHPGVPPATADPGERPEMAKMMAAMKANDEKLAELIKKMNSAQGAAKVDAIAELLTKLVDDHRTMHNSMMSHMPTMMEMMGKDRQPAMAH
jgi:hypothetical protein